MGYLEGDLTPERRRGHAVLSVRDPLVSSVLADLTTKADALPQIERWGKSLHAEARRWMARGGLSQERRLTKRDADMIWRRQFAGAGAK